MSDTEDKEKEMSFAQGLMLAHCEQAKKDEQTPVLSAGGGLETFSDNDGKKDNDVHSGSVLCLEKQNMRKCKRKETVPYEVAEGLFIALIDVISDTLDNLAENDPHRLTLQSRLVQFQATLSVCNFEIVRAHTFIKQFATQSSDHSHACRLLKLYVEMLIASGRTYTDEDIIDENDQRVTSALLILCKFLEALHYVMSASTTSKERRKWTMEFKKTVIN